MIAADSPNVNKEFAVLLEELKKYNPELMDKNKILAISKWDLLDDELKEATRKELPKSLPTIFISSITQTGLTELKDLIWKNLQ